LATTPRQLKIKVRAPPQTTLRRRAAAQFTCVALTRRSASTPQKRNDR
jgi:hypothetical protein